MTHAPPAACRPLTRCFGWCDDDPAKHKLLCETSWEHFGNDWNHTCTRPELWLAEKVDPWLRDPVSGAIIGIEAEPVPPPLRVKVWRRPSLQCAITCWLTRSRRTNDCASGRRYPPPLPVERSNDARLTTVAGARGVRPNAERARSRRPRPARGR